MSAVSKKFKPASRQMSIRRRASTTSVVPHFENIFTPPNVPVPKLKTGTFRPLRPSKRYSISIPLYFEMRSGAAQRRCRRVVAHGFQVLAVEGGELAFQFR